MKRLKYRFISSILFISLFTTNNIIAQISHGGKPYSFSEPSGTIQRAKSGNPDVRSYKVPDLDRNMIANELELLNECKECNTGFYYGKEVDVRIDFFQLAHKIETSEKTNVWILKLESEKAEGYQLIFSQFELVKGSQLFIYNEERSMVLGSFTDANNREDFTFLTQYVNGNTVYIEFTEPKTDIKSRIFIDKVVYIFDECFSGNKGPFSPDGAAKCHINTSCPEGAPYDVEIKSTVMILEKQNNDYWGVCTGALVNDGMNYASNNFPYVLTANHCYQLESGRYSNVSNWLFLFRHESSYCSSDGSEISKDTTKSALGASVLARDDNSATSDYLLLRLLNTVKEISAYNIAFAGYDLNEPFMPPGSFGFPVVGIMHPKGDTKKILISERELKSVGWNKEGNDHWEVISTQGFKTEPSASGSPLFDKNHKIIGTCHGGKDDITCNVSREKFASIYGKLSEASKNKTLKKYLKSSSAGPYIPPFVYGDFLTLSTSAKIIMQGNSTTINFTLKGRYEQEGEKALYTVIVNKIPYDNTTYYGPYENNSPYYIYYHDTENFTVQRNGNEKTIYLSHTVQIPPFEEPGEYLVTINACRSYDNYTYVAREHSKITVSPPGTNECGDLLFYVSDPKEKYAVGSTIYVQDAMLNLKNRITTLSSSDTQCYDGRCVHNSPYYKPRYWGICKRIIKLNGETIVENNYTTSREYNTTNPGTYYAPRSSRNPVYLTQPGINKLEIFMYTAKYDLITNGCNPIPNTTFSQCYTTPASRFYAMEKVIVADCDGKKVVKDVNDPLISITVTDQKKVGAGTIELQNIILSDGAYQAEAYKAVVLKPGTIIKEGTFFVANITLCPGITKASAPLEPDDIEVTSFSHVKVSPNPSKGEVTIEVENAERISAQLYNTEGKKVGDFIDARRIDISYLPTGMYLLHVYFDNAMEIHKIILEK